MRKIDVKPGVVYAYKRYGTHVTDPVEPIVFLSDHTWIGTLRQDAPYSADQAFKRPAVSVTKPRAGTVYNDGTIGFPAAIGPEQAIAGDLVALRALRLADFDRARETHRTDGLEFILVTSMARVVGEWED